MSRAMASDYHVGNQTVEAPWQRLKICHNQLVMQQTYFSLIYCLHLLGFQPFNYSIHCDVLAIAETKSIHSISGTISIILLYTHLTFNHPRLVNRHIPTFVNALEAPQKSSPSRCENRLWSMNYSRSSGVRALILQAITPCAEEGLAT